MRASASAQRRQMPELSLGLGPGEGHQAVLRPFTARLTCTLPLTLTPWGGDYNRS